jgi:ParB-like chromosome segregation protein Spo0J
MTVEIWPIERLIPYARNPRQIPQSAIDKVAASIQEFGFRQPIVVDGKGVIIVGHVRLLAAQQLRLTEVPVHVATELTNAQVNCYRLADNRTNEEATWDMEALALELAPSTWRHSISISRVSTSMKSTSCWPRRPKA